MQLKTIFIFLLLLVITESCKRADDDPWFTFYTRDQRLEGGWHLKQYFLNADNNALINTVFSSTACDTGSLGGLREISLSQESDFLDTTLVASVVQTNTGQASQVYNYNITFSYDLTVEKKGTYSCSGSYRFLDPAQNRLVEGDFSTDEKHWYWSEDSRKKTAVTFIDFPIIDATAIQELGSPLRYIATKTFDLAELRDKKMRFMDENTSSTNNVQNFSAYTVYTELDTIYNCTRQISTESTDTYSSEWEWFR
ncbi:MAG: hypothetical protein JNM36_17810 [Chitinophagales bacterium]|nr:hypothetical protein [Chitinophagales bacterium]